MNGERRRGDESLKDGLKCSQKSKNNRTFGKLPKMRGRDKGQRGMMVKMQEYYQTNNLIKDNGPQNYSLVRLSSSSGSKRASRGRRKVRSIARRNCLMFCRQRN